MAQDTIMVKNILNDGMGKEDPDKTTVDKVGKRVQRAFVYIVECGDRSLYTGIAKNLKKRMREHYDKAGKGAKYTRSRGIVSIVMVWEAASYASAARLEYGIKHLARKDKLKLIADPAEGIKEMLPGLAAEIYEPKREYVMDVGRFLAEEGVSDC